MIWPWLVTTATFAPSLKTSWYTASRRSATTGSRNRPSSHGKSGYAALAKSSIVSVLAGRGSTTTQVGSWKSRLDRYGRGSSTAWCPWRARPDSAL